MTPTRATSTLHRSTALHAALWIVQLLLALAFGMSGAMKTTQAIDSLAAVMPWSADLPAFVVRFIGACELAGALGLVLPSATRIRPLLTPLAAIGLVVVMMLGSLFHASRGEWQNLPVNAVLGGLAAFVAWGRLRRAPIPPRS